MPEKIMNKILKHLETLKFEYIEAQNYRGSQNRHLWSVLAKSKENGTWGSWEYNHSENKMKWARIGSRGYAANYYSQRLKG